VDPSEPMADRSSAPVASLATALPPLLEKRVPAYLDDLGALVNLDSGTYDRDDVAEVGRWLLGRISSWPGATTEIHHNDQFADSFSVTLSGRGTRQVMLLGHFDTVFPHGTAAARGFRIDGNRALGPGTCDMKGGLLAAINAIEALASIHFDQYQALRCVFTSDEEVGAPSSRDFLLNMAEGMDAVLVLEAGRENGDIVDQRSGGGFYRLEVHGRSAHAGVEPQKGRSAALSLCRQIIALQAKNDFAEGRTVNVGTITSGTRPNVVPDLAVAEVDLRARTQSDMDRLLQEAEVALAGSVDPDITYTWTPVQFRPPWERNERTAHLLALAVDVASQLGFPLAAAATGGTSDGNFTAALGVPTLDGLGPVGGLDHSPFEYIDITSIVPRTALLAGLIASICTL
jgi:glutamate carboxypeptidase